MKYLKNGSIGTYDSTASFSGATVVSVTKSHAEFQDSTGVRYFTSYDYFSEFDYSSDGTPLTEKAFPGATIYEAGTPRTVVGTIVEIGEAGLTYQPTTGPITTIRQWTFQL